MWLLVTLPATKLSVRLSGRLPGLWVDLWQLLMAMTLNTGLMAPVMTVARGWMLLSGHREDAIGRLLAVTFRMLSSFLMIRMVVG